MVTNRQGTEDDTTNKQTRKQTLKHRHEQNRKYLYF